MLKTSNNLILSWGDINDLINDMAYQVATETPVIDSITGLARGGLIPAVMLSHKLNIPYTNVIKSTTLVVDDICDSGKTLHDGVGVYTAVLVYKPHTSCHVPNIWGVEYLENSWVTFPWELASAPQKRDKTLTNK